MFVYSDSLVVLATWAGTASGSSRSFQGGDVFFPTVFTFLQAQQLGEVGLPPLQLLHVLLQDGDVLVQGGLEGETNTSAGRKKSQTLGFIAVGSCSLSLRAESCFFCENTAESRTASLKMTESVKAKAELKLNAAIQ